MIMFENAFEMREKVVEFLKNEKFFITKIRRLRVHHLLLD